MRDTERTHTLLTAPTADQELLARLKSGDDRALADLSDAYSSKIYQLAFRYLRNKEDAEEITQDVLFKVYRKVDAFRGDAQLSSWIYRITFNAAMSRLRTARYQRAQAEDRRAAAATEEDGTTSSRAADVADWSDMADERVLRSQLRRRVFRAILALPAIYRAPVMLRDIQGMSTEEASAVLRVKDQTLKSRLHRGRLILRKQLADFAGGLTLHRPATARFTKLEGQDGRDGNRRRSPINRRSSPSARYLGSIDLHRVVERDLLDRTQRRQHDVHDPGWPEPDRHRAGASVRAAGEIGRDEH